MQNSAAMITSKINITWISYF